MRRLLTVAALSGLILGSTAGIAVAQSESAPPAPPVANCDDPFSVVLGVCQVPVSVYVPVEIGSIFAPPPTTP